MKIAWLPAVALLALPLAGWSAEKAEKGETHLTMDQVPAPVKATLEKESAGGKVEEIEQETERGKTIYEAEIVKKGHESYVHVSADGKVLKRETAAQERKAEPGEKAEHEKAEHEHKY